ncbi:cilia and flagella-associated protein 47-like isoform X3 [Littorina saxatilis]|uniref:cilia and flagella-associated protein 47-like isoform X3 n=1 Tax=Littorina saxatilis TaxID=31220 RepID=UPI0038B61345
MEGDTHGVRIVPPVLLFDNTLPGKVYTQNVSVKNVAGSSRSIRYYGPKSKHFKLKVKNPESTLASGLSVSAVVEYEPTEETEMKDRLVVIVNGEVIEVPIFGYPTRPALEIKSKVDFGNVLANSKVIAREISLVNSGSKAGEFKIDYNGSKPIAIIPNQGSVPPDSVQLIKVEFVSKVPGRFEEFAEVTLEGREPLQLKIRGNVAKPALEVLSIKDEHQIKCVGFGNTYYGTDRTAQAILYNNGPELINYLAIVDEDAIAQELGIDLTQTTTSALADEIDGSGKKGHTNEITSLVTAIPNQGVLLPYQKVPIFFRFSPRWNASKLGWKSLVSPPTRKDFALFVRLEIIGSSKGFIEDDVKRAQGTFAEIALTGTALPVLLDISPSNKFDFGECPVGEHADVLCTIRNESQILPAIFQFRRIAHFSVKPPNGKIPPGHTQDVIFSFAPKQVGTFKPQQLLDVLGQVADNLNPVAMHLMVISTLGISLSGYSNPISVQPKARFNPGLTPYISNEVGMYCDTNIDELGLQTPRNTVAGASQTRLHRLRPRSIDLGKKTARVAFPNDRAHSVRPSERHQPYKTLFTGMDRYNYVDSDYAFEDDEISLRKGHRNAYVEHLHFLRDHRHEKMQQKEYKQTNNLTDIGIKSAAGLKPRRLKVDEIIPDPPPPSPPNAEWKLLSTKELSEAQKEAMSKPVQEGLNAVPTTPEEKLNCKKWLTPQELHQVIVGPPTIEFGKVCLRSVSQKELNIVNNLKQYILVEADIDCRELRQSSPLSQVVPPRSRAVIPIIFESSTKGNFQSLGRVARSVTYTINKFYKNHVTVTAEVVNVGLEMSTDNLILKPTPGLPAEAGFRSVITLHNRLNYQADFSWSPCIGINGTAFSIRPASGIVNSKSSLDCEVVWHPAFMAPEDGAFQLLVNGGTPLQLNCRAELGTTVVSFVESRIIFGPVPVNLTTTKVAMLHNSGSNHAYFQVLRKVLDPNPFPGLTVTPVHGVVPVGGTAEIRVSLTPEAILKFDTRVQVAVKGSKVIELRMGGTVEAPEVDIDVPNFHFGGVYCGSRCMIPFKMINKGQTRCTLEFDLTRYKDFTLKFPGFQTPEDHNYQLLNPGMSSVTLAPMENIEGQLLFIPGEVAAYDFIMPVVINHLGAPSPASTPFPPTPAPSKKNSIQHIVNPRPQPFTVATPRKHVIATGLRQPLQLSHTKVEFSLPVNFHEMSKNTGIGAASSIVLVNNSVDKLKWGFDLRKVSKAMEDGILKFLHHSGVPFISFGKSKGIEGELDPGQTMAINVFFCPREPGLYDAVVPVIINEQWDTPYQMLYITGKLQEPKVWFDPPGICMTPVPLLTDIHCEFNVLASQYQQASQLTVETPEVECDDGEKIFPVKVTFLQGNDVQQCAGDSGQIDPCYLPCRVTFSSPKPVSFTKPIVFRDSQGRCFSIPLTATADNSILSCYPFLALNRTSHTIVREEVKGEKGYMEAMILPVHSPKGLYSRPSTSATSSAFQISSSSYENSPSATEAARKKVREERERTIRLNSLHLVQKKCQVCIDSTGNSTPGPRDGAMNKPPTSSEFHSRAQNHPPEAASRLGSAMFPDEDSEEGIFHMEVLGAAQRWFSAQGWPGGPFPISIPDTMRMSISRKLGEGVMLRGAGGGRKDSKTIYDMIGHLSGRSVPGIPINSPLPVDPVERVKQIYWQHSTLLTFLRCQGACLASIRPEYLMTPRDFKIWQRLQMEIQDELRMQGLFEEAAAITFEEDMEVEVFEAVSKRAWTDILLQILKTLILAKVTPRAYKTLPVAKDEDLPPVSPDPLASNIYSIGERHLLAWLNHYYNTSRNSVWQNGKKGGVPSPRWVVNFELDLMDGLVLGAVIGAHMPFVTKSHLEDMYTHPTTAEQCLHNALKVVTALRYAGMDYDIQAVDITDPNPVMMLLFVVQLFHILPQYLSKATMDFTGTLHSTVTRQVKISNPSSKALTYHILLAGRDSRDFIVSKGTSVTIPPRQTIPLSVEFTSRYLRPAEAMLVLVGTRQGSSTGTTLTFKLRTQIDNITPSKRTGGGQKKMGSSQKGSDQKCTYKVESPCYELERIILNVENPFEEPGRFRIILVESSGDLLDPTKPTALIKPREIKPKKIRSKTDHGQSSADSPQSPTKGKGTNAKDVWSLKKDDDTPKLSAFFSPMGTVYLKAKSKAEVEVDFLPFSVGERQCSVIFLNETIGEFLYSIEAKAALPLPSPLPYAPSSNSVRISSAALPGAGEYGGDDNVVFWKCEANQALKENLLIPVTNMAKERALILAAQQHMSDVELERRHLTGTLMSCSVTAKATKMLATDPDSVIKQAKGKGPGGAIYILEYDSESYKMQELVTMPSPKEGRLHGTPSNTKIPEGVNLDDGMVEIPVEFKAKNPGHYPCQIILRSMDDIRVYRIECTVNPEGSTAELQFSAPVHQSIMQEIPIVNVTNHDWMMNAKIEGDGFQGPESLLAKAYQKTTYPLTFQPVLERLIKGKLTLTNAEDGQDHVFHLIGKPDKPLALDHIKLRLDAKKVLTHTVKIPNATKKKLFYKVESDLPFVTGPEIVSVLPRQSTKYTMTLAPRHRGTYTGILAFIAGVNPVCEVDSDGDEIPLDPDVRDYDGYRVWYSLEVTIRPAPPERVVSVTCACQKKMLIEVIVRNPTPQDITLTATVQGRDLLGPDSISLAAGEKAVYTLTYAPTLIGKSKGSLVFYNEIVGEFWYQLDLDAQSPPPTTLPHMECELGKWAEQMINLQNVTDETLELIPTVSNSNNFCLVRDNERPILLRPKTCLEVPLHFMPSTLGQADHLAKIIFISQQLGEWVFVASGTGLLPLPQDPVRVFTGPGSNTTLIIPFRNPMDTPVVANVVLKDYTENTDILRVSDQRQPFLLMLKNMKTVLRVAPKTTLDIPLSFAPVLMKKYEALCTVIITKEDGTCWDYVPKDDNGYPVSSTQGKGVQEIRWLFPVYGIPESHPVRDSNCAVVQCQARDSVEQRLEVQLAGVVASVGSQQKNVSPTIMLLRDKSATSQSREGTGSIVLGETMQTTDEFTFELYCNTDEMREVLPNSVQLALVRQKRNASGLVVLLFNIKFNPFRTMNFLGYLSVTGAMGGLWKFPVRFVATDPPVDDIIHVEASGLGKLSSVGFRLHSQTKLPAIFNAYFEEGSDHELNVAPQTGELLPEAMGGTVFNVSFTPMVYGRIYKGKLIIQSPDMQWSYDVRGVIPEYSPPQGRSSIPPKGPLPDKKQRQVRNYILDNLKLTTTGVCSPIKGAPLVGAQ